MLEKITIPTPVLIQDLGVIFTNSGKERRSHGIYKYSCGNEFKVTTKAINSGKTKSCGCYQKKRASQSNIIHGFSTTILYSRYSSMKSRCYCISDYHYEWYGTRGIQICDEWNNSFKSFYNWAISNGWDKSLEIDRINNDGNYEPSNCHWVTKSENLSNTREITKANTSGYRNIALCGRKYRVIVKGIHIGMFETLDEAVIARNKNHTRFFNEA